MHELSIATSLIDIVVDTAEKNDAKKVTNVYVQIGRLAGVEDNALLFAYDAVKEEYGLLKDSRLVIENVAITGKCRKCGVTDTYDDMFFACSACGAFEVDLLTGEELKITEIEVD